ncbi:MAG TPA: hypothetical protein VJ045_11625 [Hyphomicrobiaceae bacterium]|nr:hypothetical protein [Hyphomicrobiaceae bacterium]
MKQMRATLAAAAAVLIGLGCAGLAHAKSGGHGFRGGGAFTPHSGFSGGPRIAGPRMSGHSGMSFRAGHGSARFHGWKGHGPRLSWHNFNNNHHGHHHKHRRVIIGYPYFSDYGYYDDYAYDYGECDWLYRKAVRTGSPYWWQRYQDCVD